MNFSENVHCSMMIITMMAGRGHAEDGADDDDNDDNNGVSDDNNDGRTGTCRRRC